MLRAVLDTNVLVPLRMRLRLRDLAEARLFAAIWSPWIIAELNRVLTWRWIERTGGDTSNANQRRCAVAANTMMDALLGTFELSDPRQPYPEAWPALADEDDRAVWATAIQAAADVVVSDNTRDFPPLDAEGRHRWEGIEYVTADAFVRRLLAGGIEPTDPGR